MSRPRSTRRSRSFGRDRRAGELRGHHQALHHREDEPRGLRERGAGEPDGDLPRLPGGGPGHEETGQGEDRQHGVARRAHRAPRGRGELRGRQGRDHRPHPDPGPRRPGRAGVYVNCIAPGPILTELTKQVGPEVFKTWNVGRAVNKDGLPEDVAARRCCSWRPTSRTGSRASRSTSTAGS
ncbi:MAG: hypothetical protein MZV63_60180 [Marinilabiliales bacterium]|nr:hypothetical protein [Marinilabiliales bacterium]